MFVCSLWVYSCFCVFTIMLLCCYADMFICVGLVACLIVLVDMLVFMHGYAFILVVSFYVPTCLVVMFACYVFRFLCVYVCLWLCCILCLVLAICMFTCYSCYADRFMWLWCYVFLWSYVYMFLCFYVFMRVCSSMCYCVCLHGFMFLCVHTAVLMCVFCVVYVFVCLCIMFMCVL